MVETGKIDATYADTIEDGKEIWRTTADYDLHDADSDISSISFYNKSLKK